MIACLTVPFFAAAVERRHGDHLAKIPLVIGGQPWEPQPVYAFSREVAYKGVRPGMSLRLAHVLSPNSKFMPPTPPLYLNASSEITDILTDFTHLVEPEALWLPNHFPEQQRAAVGRSLPARFTLDLESLESTSAMALVKEMGRTVRQHTHLSPAISLAANWFVAQVAAAHTKPNHARRVLPGQEVQFLASRTIRFLPLARETRRRLLLLGIRTLGQLASLPLSGLRDQFGSEFLHFYRLAQGYVGNEGASSNIGRSAAVTQRSVLGLGDNPQFSIQPRDQEKQEKVTHHFDDPIGDIQTLERILAQIATELAGRLQSAGLEGRTLELVLKTDGQPGRTINSQQPIVNNQHLTLRHPTADPGRLIDALGKLLRVFSLEISHYTKIQLDFGVISMAVTLTNLAPTTSRQVSIFPESIAVIRKGQQISEAIQNVLAKHGSDCFYRPLLTHGDHPLPERRYELQAYNVRSVQLRRLAPV
jgi:nucleotidyltransferase/DNA polymerase involved in DNA repair